jgi:enediyne biosynthesis protein E4
MKCYYVPLLVVFFIGSCRNKVESSRKLFSLMQKTGIEFNNKVIDDSLENSFLFRNFYNGGGVAIGDINNDGLADVFLTSNVGANKLYLNKGSFQFEDISEKAGIIHDDKWNTGVVLVDINADGWLDIYVSSSGHMGTGSRKNKLYINNRNLRFTESASKFGLDISAYTTQASFFDYDLDGDLDCFMINNSPIPINQLNFANRRDLPDSVWQIADFLKGGGDHLYRNDNNFFKEVTAEAGIHGGLISFGLGVSVGDINNDDFPDIFVSNDSYERDYLYINQKNGTFKDELEDWFQHTSFSSMGADIADINNDGFPEIFTTDMLPADDYRLKTTGSFDHIDMFNRKLKEGFYFQYTKNCLQLNNKNGKFIDISRYSGVAATDWSWGALMFDMDSDGWNDLLVCNGVNRDVTNLDFMNFFANDVIQKMVMTGKREEVDKVLKEIPQNPIPNKVYRNEQNLKFADIGEAWGMGQPSFSNGAAYGDLDNDGDLDLIINNENQPAFIYKNNSIETRNQHYLGVILKGQGLNTFAIGAEVQLYSGTRIFTREQIPSRGFQSSVDYKLIFGLGNTASIDSMVVIWPDRTVSRLIQPVINQVHIVDQELSKKERAGVRFLQPEHAYFTNTSQPFSKHEENEYTDFYTERGVPRLLSREGPKAAYGDVNGDNLWDVFIGGTVGHPGKFYWQTTGGQFEPKENAAIQQFNDFEDVAVLLFDADNDNDLDLVIGPGGNESDPNTRQMQLRLFKNDGKGNFSLDVTSFPNTGMNISVIAENDFNKDGYIDLFVGGRNYYGIYGKDPESFLFVNDGKGHFTDILKSKNPELATVGMVTGAVWVNVDENADNELVIVGEWMAPRIFSFKKDHFVEIKSNVNELFGWWQTVIQADLNKDGKNDLVLGNIGENFYLHPGKETPVKLWINDFDKNDNIDKIITYTIDGKDKPVFLKHDLQEQIPGIKKDNLRHEEYAKRSIQELFPKALVESAIIKSFNYPSSVVAINNGNGNFTIQKLPVQAQLSCINAMVALDVNKDGAPDLITGGNEFGLIPQFEKLDGNFGEVLLNDGKGGFISCEQAITGFQLRGEVRDIAKIKTQNGWSLLFLQNNEKPLLFKLNNFQ